MQCKEDIGIGIESGSRFIIFTLLCFLVFEAIVSAVSEIIHLGTDPVRVVISSARSIVDSILTVPR